MMKFYYIYRDKEVRVTMLPLNTSALKEFKPLTKAQSAFYEAHPHASIAEIVSCALREVPLSEAKAKALYALGQHDTSPLVNGFLLGGQPMWLSKEERAGLRMRFDAEEAADHTTTTLWAGDQRVTLPLPLARELLHALELYAAACYDTTAAHRAAINALTTTREVQEYDFTTGYPTQPSFDVPGQE